MLFINYVDLMIVLITGDYSIDIILYKQKITNILVVLFPPEQNDINTYMGFDVGTHRNIKMNDLVFVTD